MRNIYSIVFLFTGLLAADTFSRNQGSVLQSPYLNTSFLRDYNKTYHALCADEFKPVTFKTEDNLTIHGLYLTRPQMQCTVICCAGWLPGRKEGMASFYPMLPDDCDILLFDARGHGASDGLLWRDAWWYGQYEYRDILAAIDFVRHNSQRPIVLLGICAGAFHAMHALYDLHAKEQLKEKQIAGLIFDSGWVSVDAASCSAVQASARDWLTRSIARLYGLSGTQHVQSTFLFSCCSMFADSTIRAVHTVFFKLPFWYMDESTNLMVKARKGNLGLPILFIHAYDDTYVPINVVQSFAQQIEQTSCWWVDKSKHACNHLKYTAEYMERIKLFINTSVGAVVCQDTKGI